MILSKLNHRIQKKEPRQKTPNDFRFQISDLIILRVFLCDFRASVVNDFAKLSLNTDAIIRSFI